MILLDTNALIWFQRNHPRGKKLAAVRSPLFVSPTSLLEIQLLTEVGRLRLKGTATPRDLLGDRRLTRDDPSSVDWFDAALEIAWTRDTFDRLLVAHARLRRWRLATGDTAILQNLNPTEYFEL